MYHEDVVVVVNRHDDCGVPPGVPECVSARKRVDHAEHMSKPEGSARWNWRSTWLQRRDDRSCILLPRRASQFDPAIDKERKLISNLRWNMPVLLDSPECMALTADMEGDRLNSWFQYNHNNKLIKAHVGMTFLAILSCTHRRCWTGCKPCPWPLSRIASCFAVHDLFWALRGIYHVWAYTYLLASSFACRLVFMHVWYYNVLALSFQLTWRDLLALQPISFQQVISYHLYRLNSFAMSLGNVIFTAIKIIQPMVR